jgi:hypothetical protein
VVAEPYALWRCSRCKGSGCTSMAQITFMI